MTPGTASTPAVTVRDMRVAFRREGQELRAVNGVDFDLQRGEVLGIIGESGSGKSVTLRALMGLLPAYAELSGRVTVTGHDIAALSAGDLQKLRGRSIAMIFQEPATALDPVYTIGRQIAETIVQHEGADYATATRRALDLLELVAIPSAARRLKNYPHELSGGMRQRAMIALALACRPAVLLADEPTTALDATVQIQLLLLLRRLQRDLDMAVVFVTHDMGVAAEISDRMAVMYGGRFVETGSAEQIMRDPRHPYTKGLLASTVHAGMRGRLLEAIPGSPPNLAAMPPGCAFAPRCPLAVEACADAVPDLAPLAGGRAARCIGIAETV
jgi:peptide/nickel transport system ATP-binding protein